MVGFARPCVKSVIHGRCLSMLTWIMELIGPRAKL